MGCRLHEAALTGDTASLLSQLEKDSLLLDRPFVDGETPLHVAALYGHVEFSETVLCLRPKLASALDSGRRSPLHLASMKGHVGIVKLLLQTDPAMCLARDQDGMTPLHAAALKGRVEAVKEMVRANKIATRVLTTNTREPILHMCVNHSRFDVVKALLECARGDDDDELVKMKDDDDNTILHVTVAKKHIPLTKFLLRETMMKKEVNALNVNGFTALDIFLQNRSKSSNDIKLEGILRGNKARKASLMPLPKDVWMAKPSNRPKKDRWKKHVRWLNDTRSALMIVAILIATITYQGGFNPPGGVWQEDDEKNGVLAGQSVIVYRIPYQFVLFTFSNSIGFISSLMIILLLISGFPLKRRIFMWTLMIITWIALSSMIFSYILAVVITSSSAVSTLNVTPFRYMGLMLLVPIFFIAAHILRSIIKWCRMIYSMTKRGVISIDM